jgi:hypothetical protein
LAIKKRKTKQKSAKRLPLKAISQRGEQGSVPTATHFVIKQQSAKSEESAAGAKARCAWQPSKAIRLRAFACFDIVRFPCLSIRREG